MRKTSIHTIWMDTTSILLSTLYWKDKVSPNNRGVLAFWPVHPQIHKKIPEFEVPTSLWWQLLTQLGAHPIIVGNTFPPCGCSFTSKSTASTHRGSFSIFFFFLANLFSYFLNLPLNTLPHYQSYSTLPPSPLGNGNFSFCFTAKIKEEKEERRRNMKKTEDCYNCSYLRTVRCGEVNVPLYQLFCSAT